MALGENAFDTPALSYQSGIKWNFGHPSCLTCESFTDCQGTQGRKPQWSLCHQPHSILLRGHLLHFYGQQLLRHDNPSFVFYRNWVILKTQLNFVFTKFNIKEMLLHHILGKTLCSLINWAPCLLSLVFWPQSTPFTLIPAHYNQISDDGQ